MSMHLEDGTVAACVAIQETCDTRNGCRTGRSTLRRLAVTDTCQEEPRHLQTLAHRLQFRKRGDVAEEVRDLPLRAALPERGAETLEARIGAPGAFGEAFLGHRVFSRNWFSATLSGVERSRRVKRRLLMEEYMEGKGVPACRP